MDQSSIQLIVNSFISNFYNNQSKKEIQNQQEIDKKQQALLFDKYSEQVSKYLYKFKPQFLQIFLGLIKFSTYKSVIILTQLCLKSFKVFKLSIFDIQYLFQIILKSRFKFANQKKLAMFIDLLQRFIDISNQQCFKNVAYLAVILKILSKKYPRIQQSQIESINFLNQKQENLRLQTLLKGKFLSSSITLESSKIQIHENIFNSIIWIIIQRGKDYQVAWKIAQQLMKVHMSTRMVKNMVRKLEIKQKGLQKNIESQKHVGNSKNKQINKQEEGQLCIFSNNKNEWKDIFKLMTCALQMYQKNYDLIKFQKPTAFLLRKSLTSNIPKPSIFQLSLRTFPASIQSSNQNLIVILFTNTKNLEYWIMLTQFYDQQNHLHCIFSIVQCQGGIMWRKAKKDFKTVQEYSKQKHYNKETFSQTQADLKQDQDSSCIIQCPIKWYSLWQNTVYLQITQKQINLIINIKDQNIFYNQENSIKAPLSLQIKDIQFTGISIGGGYISTNIDELYSFNYYPYLELEQLINYLVHKNTVGSLIQIDLLKLKSIPELKSSSGFNKTKSKDINLLKPIQNRKNIKKQIQKLEYLSTTFLENNETVTISQNSFISIIKQLGDLDLFFLLTSHIIKKNQNSKILVGMIVQIMTFFGRFVDIKGVKQQKLSQQDQKSRVSNVLCLCWLVSKQVKPQSKDQTEVANVIMSLLKLLGIRGGGKAKKMQITGMLQVLCNFSFWQKLNYLDQTVLLKETKALLMRSLKNNYMLGNEQFLDKNKIRKNSQYLKDIQQQQQNILIGLEFWKRLLFELVYFYRIKGQKAFFNSMSMGSSNQHRSSKRSIIQNDQDSSSKLKNSMMQQENKLLLQAQIIKILEVYIQELIQRLFSIQGLNQKFIIQEGKRLTSKQRILKIKNIFQILLYAIQLLVGQRKDFVQQFIDKGLGIQLSFLLKKMSKKLYDKYIQSHSQHLINQQQQNKESFLSSEKTNKLGIQEMKLILCQEILDQQMKGKPAIGIYKDVSSFQSTITSSQQFQYYSPVGKSVSSISSNLIIFNETPSSKISYNETPQSIKYKKFPQFHQDDINFLSQVAQSICQSFNKFFMIENTYQFYQFQSNNNKKYFESRNSTSNIQKYQKISVSDDVIKQNLNDFIVYIQSMNTLTYKNMIYKKSIEEYNENKLKSIIKIHLIKSFFDQGQNQKKNPKSSFTASYVEKLSYILQNQRQNHQFQRLFKTITGKVFEKIPINQDTFQHLLKLYIMEDSISCLPTYKIMSYISKQFIKKVQSIKNKNNNISLFQSSAFSNIKFVNTKIKDRVIKALSEIIQKMVDLCAFELQPHSKSKVKGSFKKQVKTNKILSKIHILISMFSQLNYQDVFNILTLMQVCGYSHENLQILKLQIAIRQIIYYFNNSKKESLKQQKDKMPYKCRKRSSNQVEMINESGKFGQSQIQIQLISVDETGKESTSSPLQRFLNQNQSSLAAHMTPFIRQQQKIHSKILQLTNQISKFDKIISQKCIQKVLKCKKEDIQIHLENYKININDGLIDSLKKLDPKNQNYFKSLSQVLGKYKDLLQIHLLHIIQEQTIMKIQQICPSLSIRQSFQTIGTSQQALQNLKRSQKRLIQIIAESDLKQLSNQWINKFIQERRLSLISVQKVWSTVQENNKYFWQLFYGKQKWYSLDTFTNSLKMPVFIKISGQKPQFELPKNALKDTTDTKSKYCSIVQQSDQDQSQSKSSSSLFNDTSKLYQKSSKKIQTPGRSQSYYEQKKINNSSIFSDQQERQKIQKQLSPIKQQQKQFKQKLKQKQKQKQKNFKVLLITVDKIYSGRLYVKPIDPKLGRKFDQCQFKQYFIQNNKMYDEICAHQTQRRTIQQIDKNRKIIKINLNRYCRITRKKYLFLNCGLQIYSGSDHQTYFFCFWDKTGKQRQQFIKKFIKDQKLQNFYKYNTLGTNVQNILPFNKLINYYRKLWQLGIISNFKYLMKLNDLASRSFNDISQYYIFPWIIKDYQSIQLCLKNNQQRDTNNNNVYRDLTKPMGMINPQRFQTYQKRYKDNQSIYGKKSHQQPSKQSFSNKQKVKNNKFGFGFFNKKNQKQKSTSKQNNQGKNRKSLSGSIHSIKQKISNHNYFAQAFLYGSFYSNPAIVNNYMLRINPFSTQHFRLQTNRFDHADRLFFSIKDQFTCSSNNISDVKELIPQFYYNWQFLINRSSWKLGVRQNKSIVNDVKLPLWIKQSTGRPQQFIFKMREALQEQYVTKNLHTWIDFIFGWKNQKKYAFKNNNLYPATVYEINTSNMDSQDKQSILMCYKQFGQNPQCLFHQNHPSFEGVIKNQFMIKGQFENSQLQYYNPDFDQAIFRGSFIMTQMKTLKEKVIIPINYNSNRKQFNKKIQKSVFFQSPSSSPIVRSNSETGKVEQCGILKKFRKQQLNSLKKKMNAFSSEDNNFDRNLNQNNQEQEKSKNIIIITENFIFCLSHQNKLIICSQKPKSSEKEKEEFQVIQSSSSNFSNKSSIMSFFTSFTKKKSEKNEKFLENSKNESHIKIKSDFNLKEFNLNQNISKKQTESGNLFLNAFSSSSSIIIQQNKVQFHQQIEQNLKKPIQTFNIINLMDQNYTLHKTIIYLRNGNLYFRQIKQKFSSSAKNAPISLQFSNQERLIQTKNCFFEDMKVCKQFIILKQNNNIHFLTQKQKQIQNQSKSANNNKPFYNLINPPQFTQHQNIISHFQISQELNICISVDLNNTIFVLSLQQPPKKIFVRYTFVMNNMLLAQRVTKLMIQDLGLIIVMTNLSRILVYNLMGQLVIKSVVQIQSQDIQNYDQIQFISSVCLLNNEERPQLLFGSTKGYVYKISIFDLQKDSVTKFCRNDFFKKKKKSSYEFVKTQTNQQIVSMKTEIIGKHWQIVLFNAKYNMYAIQSCQFQSIKKKFHYQYQTLFEKEKQKEK